MLSTNSSKPRELSKERILAGDENPYDPSRVYPSLLRPLTTDEKSQLREIFDEVVENYLVSSSTVTKDEIVPVAEPKVGSPVAVFDWIASIGVHLFSNPVSESAAKN